MWYPDKQPNHVEKAEGDFIRILRQRGFSIGDIAEIMMRSKATIQNVVSKINKVNERILLLYILANVKKQPEFMEKNRTTMFYVPISHKGESIINVRKTSVF